VNTKEDILAGLKKIQVLYRKSTRWIRGASARTSPRGKYVDPENPKAACFCLTGAAAHVAPNQQSEIVFALALAVRDLTGKDRGLNDMDTVQSYNDNRYRTIQDIRSVVSTAIRIQKKAAWL
jgi:hypothetical protein